MGLGRIVMARVIAAGIAHELLNGPNELGVDTGEV
jgi:hypothetical protein